SFTPCGTSTGPYFLSSTGTSYTFAFAVPVGSVQLQVVFATAGTPGTISFEMNGSDYPITNANVAGSAPGSTCTPALAVASGGDLTNAGNESSDPSALVVIPGPLSTLKVSSVGANSAVFGMFLSPETYFQVTHTAGTAAVDGVATTVTGSGSVSTFTPCGAL